MTTTRPVLIDYLISGYRISIGPDSTTPGPRTHIKGLSDAWTSQGAGVRLFLVSAVPGLRRFASIKESSYIASSDARVWVADYVRIAASIWAGVFLCVTRLLRPAPTIIIERNGVLQSLMSFHPKKRRAVRVVEANGIYSRETALDRKVLKNVRLATAIERRVFRRADLVVAVSANLKSELLGFANLDSDRVIVVPNGVQERVADLVRVNSEDCIIGYVGALTAWQHLDRMLGAFHSRIDEMERTANTRVRLELIGEGADYDRVLAAATELGLRDRVTFWGARDHAAALGTMTRWSIGFAGHEKSSSATMYHSPLKVYEYAALGLITVCTYSDDAEALRMSGVPTHYFESSDELGDALVAACGSYAIQDAEQIAQRRRNVREQHGWPARAAQIVKAAMRRAPR